MQIAKKYAKAAESSNLRADSFHSDTDTLAAVALSDRKFGSLLFRAKYCTPIVREGSRDKVDADTLRRLTEAWVTEVSKKKADRGWPEHISAKKVAEMSLGYWLNDLCQPCGGTGKQMMAEVNLRSDDDCLACQGSGRKPLIADRAHIDHIRDMVESLETKIIYAGDEAIRMLAKDCEL